MNDLSRLYFEGHITLTPPDNEGRHTLLEDIARSHGMRVSTFAMIKPDSPQPEAFISLRDKSYASMVARIKDAIFSLRQCEFKVIRYKIEDTLLDTKHGDRIPGCQLDV